MTARCRPACGSSVRPSAPACPAARPHRGGRADERLAFTDQLTASMASSILCDPEQSNRLQVHEVSGKQEIRIAPPVQERGQANVRTYTRGRAAVDASGGRHDVPR